MDRDSQQFAGLLASSQPTLFGYIYSLVGDHNRSWDILQDVNLTVLRKARDFEEGTNFLAWSTSIAYFHVLADRRARPKEEHLLEEQLLSYLAERQAERASTSPTRLDALLRCLEHIDDDQRSLLRKRYRSNGSVKNLANEMNTTAGAISQMLRRIRKQLRLCVERRLSQQQT